jgi:hypothetical protein
MPTPLLSDSTWAISIARDPVKYELTKHVGVDAHFTRSQVQDRFRMVLLIFSMCLQSFSWLISSRRLRLAFIISFTSPNLVLLIHYEFERGIRYVLVFLLLYFSRGFFVYSPPPVHVYI